MSADLPGVSCLCLTYGRVALLEEAIESFLRQEYKGPKELIVLNDLDVQTLRFDHPYVIVVNTTERYPSIGEKRMAACAMARFDVLFPWDDDDISLPHRLDLSVRLLATNRFFKPTKAFVWQDGEIECIERNMFHGQSCIRRELLDAVGGYPPVNIGEDLAFETRLDTEDGVRFVDLAPEELFYLYRWSGDGSHISGHLGSVPDAAVYELIDDEIRRRIGAGSIPAGDVELQPDWARDYEQQARAFIEHRQSVRD